MELNSPSLSFDLIDFEDPINMEPLTDIIRCPHQPSHQYQVGTLLKRVENGKEYTQCSLTNQWFLTSEFKKDRFASNACQRIYDIHQLYLNEKEKNLNLMFERDELKNQVKDLTNQVQEVIEIVKEQKEINRKNMEEFKNIFIEKEQSYQKKMEEERKYRLEIDASYMNRMNLYIYEIEKQSKDSAELKEQNRQLLAMLSGEEKPNLNNQDILTKIAITIVGVSALRWAYNNMIPKIKGLL